MLKKISDYIESYIKVCLDFPKKIFLLILISQLILWGIVVKFTLNLNDTPTHGSLAMLSPESAVAMQGQMVYYQEGCQYCHTQNLRPINWEYKRFTDIEKLGYFPSVDPLEYLYETPYLRGSRRIGPDLSRIATKLDENAIRTILTQKDAKTLLGIYHQYSYLFENENNFEPRDQSWRVRWQMNMRKPFSSTYQRSAFTATDMTQGDLLVAYLLSRGKKQMQFSGKYYRKD